MGRCSLDVDEGRKPSPLECKSKVSERAAGGGGRAGVGSIKGLALGCVLSYSPWYSTATVRFNGKSDLWRSNFKCTTEL